MWDSVEGGGVVVHLGKRGREILLELSEKLL